MKENYNSDTIDFEFLKKIIGEDKKFEKELFEIFLDSSNYNIQKLENAIRDSDNNSWYIASHAFKGSSASIGAFPLSRELDAAQKISDDNVDKKTKILDDIKKEFQKVQDLIKKKI